MTKHQRIAFWAVWTAGVAMPGMAALGFAVYLITCTVMGIDL